MPEFTQSTESSQVVPCLHEEHKACQDWSGRERVKIPLVLCFLILVSDKTRGNKCLETVQSGRRVGEINKSSLSSNLTTEISLWLIHIWPCSVGRNDVPVCQEGLSNWAPPLSAVKSFFH